MNEFWLWFWRPIAEVLGTITMIVFVIAVAIIFVGLYVLGGLLLEKIQHSWKQFRGTK